MYLGDYPINAVVDFKFTSQGLDGSSITLATDGTLRVYKNNSVTERTSAAGITFSEDFDSVTGVHHLRIDTSDNTDASFYAAGNEYDVVVVGAVVDGITVNTTLASFSIERVGAALALAKSGTFGLAVTKTAIDAITSSLSSTNPSGFKKNTAVPDFDIVMTSSAGVPLPGLTVTAKRRIGSGAFAACVNGVSEVSDGVYTTTMAAADFNGDKITFLFTAPLAKPLFLTIYTEP